MSIVKKDTAQGGLKYPDIIFSEPSVELVLVIHSLPFESTKVLRFYMRGFKIGERSETIQSPFPSPYRWTVPADWIAENRGYLAQLQYSFLDPISGSGEISGSIIVSL